MGDFYYSLFVLYLYKQQKDIKAANQSKRKEATFSVHKGKKQNQGTIQIFSQVCFPVGSVNNCGHQMGRRRGSL